MFKTSNLVNYFLEMNPEIWKNVDDSKLAKALQKCEESTKQDVANQLRRFV